ncbi:hypothetical protein FHS57_006062 [Runella defluvii]|uniref:Uncharacterized protein n=1 Tax=Runella defluvii TaxID=370973 RepID=A0A7W5ZS06_9BACT|nr:hypothetical protein [Runella defluvii]MBB3842033.1 hypothetical protein [Runella defluvii]
MNKSKLKWILTFLSVMMLFGKLQAQTDSATVVVYRQLKFSAGVSAIAVGSSADSLFMWVRSNKVVVLRVAAGQHQFSTYLDMSDKLSKPIPWAFTIAPNETKYVEFDTKAAFPTAVPVIREQSEEVFNQLIQNPKWQRRRDEAEVVHY